MHTSEQDFSSQSHRILLAEDDPTTRSLLSRQLKTAGYTVEAVENGSKAWDLLMSDNQFDLVVTDMKMPEMDGRELISRIKESPKTKSIPVIIISGVIGFREVEDLVNLGMSRFLSKPVSGDKLRDCVLQLFRFSLDS